MEEEKPESISKEQNQLFLDYKIFTSLSGNNSLLKDYKFMESKRIMREDISKKAISGIIIPINEKQIVVNENVKIIDNILKSQDPIQNQISKPQLKPQNQEFKLYPNNVLTLKLDYSQPSFILLEIVSLPFFISKAFFIDQKKLIATIVHSFPRDNGRVDNFLKIYHSDGFLVKTFQIPNLIPNENYDLVMNSNNKLYLYHEGGEFLIKLNLNSSSNSSLFHNPKFRLMTFGKKKIDCCFNHNGTICMIVSGERSRLFQNKF